MNFQIRNRHNESTVFECDLPNEVARMSHPFRLGFAIKEAIGSGANLTGTCLTEADLTGTCLTEADLREADLTEADLTRANLREANLAGANLTGANLAVTNLAGANLTGASLTGASLTWACLGGARLTKADLSEADLSEADLSGANLSGAVLFKADLTGANLTGANLTGANLTGANLTKADLTGANLTGTCLTEADLTGARLFGVNLTGANLDAIKKDFTVEVLKMPDELSALRLAIVEGRIDGSTYSGKCACLAGTLAKARGVENYHGENIGNFRANSLSPREMWFMMIRPGDTPENNQASKIVLGWLDRAISMRDRGEVSQSA
jgi:uncharacterized protein YjbI with pentapeptide repeats